MSVKQRRLISFDWALKRLLRSKANFEILEGFLSELLRDEVRILEVLESESNKEDRYDKSNRVDLKVKNARGELIIIELQYERESDYLQRILYGTAKAITEHMPEGEPYSSVVKVISVSILYFDLGRGADYVYWGSTTFRGMHTQDELDLSEGQKALFHRDSVSAIFPEYYLIKVNRFNGVARDTLDEWIYFLKNEDIRDNFTARGILKAKEQLDILKLPEAERLAYERYKDDLHYQASMVESTYGYGKMEGRKEGRQEGEQIGEQKGRRAEAASLLTRQLQRRFGDLPSWASQKIANADLSTLEEWSLRILDATTLESVLADPS
ncbi:MAG: Rpn family recombination-promoting nuclease/putative transposase [Magnetococcales bacterium]|nr:Rpn family recombination-promoting nuclease/putative transposase [Magnetococcales bacterium]